MIRVAIVWAALSVLIVLANLGALLERRFPDPDDVLRLVQVRDLLAGQNWFDLHQYRIDAPAGTLMHWSRLVDIPLASAMALLRPVIGGEPAELATVIAIPLLTLLAIMLVVARIAGRFFNAETVTFACLALGLSPWLVIQVQPLRIDHHAWQAFTAVVALLGLLPGRDWRGAMLSAAALAFGLSISLEVLPIVVGFGSVFWLRWMTAGDTRSLPVFLATLTVGAALLLLLTRGVSDLALHCDAISPAHLTLLAIATAAASVVSAARLHSRVAASAVMAAGVGAGLALFLAVAPECAAGPFAALDPVVRHFWYDQVYEGLPVWTGEPLLAGSIVAAGLVALGVLLHLARSRPPEERRWWFEYLTVAAAAFVAGLLVYRSQTFVGAYSAVPLGWLAVRLLEGMRNAATLGRKLLAGIALVLALLPVFPSAVAGALITRDTSEPSDDTVRPVALSRCRVADSAARMNQLRPGTIFAPLDIGPALLESTHHSVVATAHHRAAEAMSDVIRAFIGSDETAHRLIREHGARYVLMCTDLPEPQRFIEKAPNGFAAQLVEGRVPAWLEPIDIGGPPELQVWRVVD